MHRMLPRAHRLPRLSRCRFLCQNWKLFFVEPILLSQEMCAAIKHVVDDSFVFQQRSTPVNGAHTQLNCCSAKLSTSFLFSYDPNRQPRT